MDTSRIIEGDSLQKLKEIEDESVDLIVTDPPYGYSFMGKQWDKAVVSIETWKECLRVLKAGAFAFVMSAPRQDVLSRMIVNLQDAGFRTDFTSIYWTYASGFPKAANVSKLTDKRNGRNYDTRVKDYLNKKRNEKGLSFQQINEYLGTATNGGGVASAIMGDKQFNELPTLKTYNKLKPLLNLDDRFDELIEREEAKRNKIPSTGNLHKNSLTHGWSLMKPKQQYLMNDNNAITEQAKKLDGSYAGFQPKPAVEVILVVMKPLSEKSFVDQALTNGKGVTWLDDCRIPFQNNDDVNKSGWQHYEKNKGLHSWNELKVEQGDRKETVLIRSNKIQDLEANEKGRFPANLLVSDDVLNDGKITKNYKRNNVGTYLNGVNDGSRSIYNSYSGRTRKDDPQDEGSYSRYFDLDKWAQFIITPKASPAERQGSTHPTQKPIKLMSFLITMGSRENDIILDPFCGSGTTLVAAYQLDRRWIGIDNNKEYVEIAKKRIEPYLLQQKMSNYSLDR